ncbi:MAG: VWA domain-containing protein [Sulfurovum sp.]|nr:MAG: VWA domain-containing protein [Sulfurovum sp.]
MKNLFWRLFLLFFTLFSSLVYGDGDIPTCDVKADIWYANDESGSINATEFSQSKIFLNEIAKRFRYSADDGVQSSLIGWGGYDLIFDAWFDYYQKEKIDYKMRINLTSDYKNQLLSYNEKLDTGTEPHSVTDYVATLIENKTGRADAAQVMVLLTDANSNQILESWVDAANRFRANTTNSKIVVVLIAEAATAYNTNSAKKSIVDRVIGENGLVIVTDSYANIVDPANDHIKDVSTAICEASKQKDFGDAFGYSEPSQAVSSNKNVFIGNTVDGETMAYVSGNASGDDNNGTDDEDGLATAQTLVAGQPYALNLKVTNKVQDGGDFWSKIYAWIDFNGDKIFQSEEANTDDILVNEGAINKPVTLHWNVPANVQGGNTIMRLRFARCANRGNPDNDCPYEGEIEDHLVGINGTQSLFNIERTNSVKNAKDYNLYTQIGGRDFDYSLVSYADESFSAEKVISDTTVKVELVDFGANEAVLYSRYIYIPTGNKAGRIDVINAEDLKNIRATKEAKFRISYPKNAQGYIINGDFSTDAQFTPLIKEISYSKDSFAIRPAGFVVDIVDGTTKLKDNSSIDALRLTSGYKYNLNVKAINIAGVATANYNTTVTDSSLAFNDSTSCSLKDSYPLNIDFISGNGTPKELKSANSGKYKIKLKDKAWTQIDSAGGCIANSSLISANGNTLSGCDISSDFLNNNVTYKDNDITFYPYKFDASNFNAINENGSTHSDFLYMNDVSVDEKMALNISGKVIAKNYENETTTNFTAGCSNEDVTIKLKYSGESDAGVFGNVNGTTIAEVIKSIKKSTLLYFTNKYTINSKVSTQNGLSTDIVVNAEDIKNGEMDVKMLYNIARTTDDEINPVKVALKSLDVSSPTSSSTSDNTLQEPIGSKIFDNVEKTFYYARIFPNQIIYPVTYDGSEETPLYAEIFCLKDSAFCSRMMGTNGLNGARTQLGWYGSINHDSSVDGKVLEIKKTALNSDMVSIVGSFNEFVNGKSELSTNYSGNESVNSRIEISDISPWLKVEDQYWINQFRHPTTRNFSGVGKTGKIVKPAPSGANLRKIDW